MSFLQTPEKVSTLCCTLFCCVLSKWTHLSCLPSVSCGFSCPQFHLWKPALPGLHIHSCQSVAPGMLLLIFVQLFQVGLGRIGLGRFLLWAIKTTCFPLNFFSNSHTSWALIFWRGFSWGMRTKIKIAFWQTSISLAAVIFISGSWAFRPEFICSSRKALEMSWSRPSSHHWASRSSCSNWTWLSPWWKTQCMLASAGLEEPNNFILNSPQLK